MAEACEVVEICGGAGSAVGCAERASRADGVAGLAIDVGVIEICSVGTRGEACSIVIVNC